jgi:hypothetical protein
VADNAVKGGAHSGEIISVDAGRPRRFRFRLRDASATAATLALAVGATFTVVGLVDLGLLWYPVRLGNAPWEFGTLSATFDNLPMTALGVALVTLGVVWHPRLGGAWVRAAAVCYLAAGVVLLAMAGLYGLAAVEVAGRAPDESLGAFTRAVVKNVAEIVAYVAASGFMAVVCWRGVERER